jgi:hypothetical protein
VSRIVWTTAILQATAYSADGTQALGIFATILLIRAVPTPTNPVHRASILTHFPNMSEQTGMGS